MPDAGSAATSTRGGSFPAAVTITGTVSVAVLPSGSVTVTVAW